VTTGLQEGDVVKVTGRMSDPDPLPIGDTGAVRQVFNRGTVNEQVSVKWKSGRSLMLLPGDPFTVVRRKKV
jgi:hypothetical protein